MIRWRASLSSGPATTPPLRLGLRSARPRPGACADARRPAPRSHGAAARSRSSSALRSGRSYVYVTSLSRAGSPGVAAPDAEIRGQRGQQPGLHGVHLRVAQRPVRRPEGEPERHAPSARRQLGTAVVALDPRPAPAASPPTRRSNSIDRAYLHPLRAAATRAPVPTAGVVGQRRELGQPAGATDRATSSKPNSGAAHGGASAVSGAASPTIRPVGVPGNPPLPSTCICPTGNRQSDGGLEPALQVPEVESGLAAPRPVRRARGWPVITAATRRSSPGRSPGLPAVQAVPISNSRTSADVVGPVGLDQPHEPGQQAAAEPGIVGGERVERAGRSPRHPARPSGAGRPRRAPASTIPRRTAAMAASSGASVQAAETERAEVGGECCRSRAAARSLRSGRSRARGRDASPGTSTAMRPSSGLETTVAPIATRYCSIALQGISTPSTWATRAGRRKMRGGCDGSGQRSSGAPASSPPRGGEHDLDAAAHRVAAAPAVDAALEAVARLAAHAERAPGCAGSGTDPSRPPRAGRRESRCSPRCWRRPSRRRAR